MLTKSQIQIREWKSLKVIKNVKKVKEKKKEKEREPYQRVAKYVEELTQWGYSKMPK